MKHYFGVFIHQCIVIDFFFLLFMIFLMLPVVTAAGGESNIDDKLISLAAKDEPLGEVLNKISKATGYEFILDDEWEGNRVSAVLEDVTLHQALNQILRDLNHVIIYGTDQKIEIIIYGKAAFEGASTVPSIDKSSAGTPVAGRPDSQAVEKEEISGTEEKPSGDNFVSGRKYKTRAVIDKRKKRRKVNNSDEE
jgi:type II secretory pathway component GspD/PulD (secretin)